MDNFKIQTSIAFPYIKLHEDVTYSEVKKPSGVAYILLVLINESKDKESLIGNLLVNFGIPKSLHFLFADSLKKLIDQDILTGPDYISNLDDIPIRAFEFTQKGKIIFEEEAIPTGVNKIDRIDIFYDIAQNEFSFEINKSLEPRPIVDSFLSKEFVEKFKCKKTAIGFLNLHKGQRWPKFVNGRVSEYLLIKKEEVITNVEEIDEKEYWLAKQDCIMEIKNDDIKIKFDNDVLNKFFNDNYTNEMINNAIAYKNKFKFNNPNVNKLLFSTFNNYEIKDIILPYKLEDALSKNFKYSITKGAYKCNEGLSVLSENGLKSVNENFDFIGVDEKNNIYSYVCGIFMLNSDIFGTIELPLAIKLKSNKYELQKATIPYLDSLREYSEENFAKIVKITNFTDDLESASEIIKEYFNLSPLENITRLNFVRSNAFNNNEISKLYKQILSENYNLLLNSINKDNFETILKVTKSTPKVLGIDEKTILSKISDNIKNISNLEAYELLVENGFDAELVSLYFNPLKEAILSSTVRDPNLLNFVKFNGILDEIKNKLNLKNYIDYTIDEDQLNKEEFSKLFKQFIKLYNSILIFKNCDSTLFNEYEMWKKLFTPINDDINMQIEASKKPDKITFNMIDNKINSGDYRSVLANLSVKLEYLLSKYYKASGEALFEMLKSSKGINANVMDELHRFRDARNSNLHYDKENDFTVDELRKWSKIIFDLEVKDEPKSSN